MWKKFGLGVLLVLSACTKQPSTSVAVSDKPLITPVQNPERAIFEASVILPPQHKAKVKPTDLVLWDLKDQAGGIIASSISSAPKFPFSVRVLARNMIHAIPEDSILLFSVRVVPFGQENNPPAKGQLSATVGVVPSKAQVVNPNVDQKRYAQWAKKNNIAEEQVLNVGAKVSTPLTPSIW